MTARPRRRRILLVTNWIGSAGAETQLKHLAIGLTESGHSVVLLAIRGIVGENARLLEEAGVKTAALDARGRVGKLFGTVSIARFARKADVVLCAGWDATLWGRLGAFLARRPVVITEHTPGRELQRTDNDASRVRAIGLHNRLLDPITHTTITVGSWQKELLEGEGVRPSSIVHIPNAVPVGELRSRAENGPDRASLGIPPEALVVIQVARFAAQKGQATTLRAVDRLRSRLGDVRLLFAGSGLEEAAVRSEAEALGADWAGFLGPRDDIPGLLKLADLSVLPSTGEGLPMSLIESAAVGTPIVATDVGDVRWLLESTGAGICVRVGDDDGFVQACAAILGDAEVRRGMSEAAERAGGDFDAPKMISGYEEVFEAACTAPRRR